MRIAHPDTGQIADVDDQAYDLVWKVRGWVPAEDADLPLPDIAAMTIDAVHAYLEANPTRVAEVLQAEQDGKARKTLVTDLEERAAALPDPTPAVVDGGQHTPTTDTTEPVTPADTTTPEEHTS